MCVSRKSTRINVQNVLQKKTKKTLPLGLLRLVIGTVDLNPLVPYPPLKSGYKVSNMHLLEVDKV